jgi:hypothetical protein
VSGGGTDWKSVPLRFEQGRVESHLVASGAFEGYAPHEMRLAAIRAEPPTAQLPKHQSTLTLEELYCAFVLFGCATSIKGAQVFSLTCFRVNLARIEPVFTGLQFSNH